MSKPRRWRRGERYGGYDDDMAVQYTYDDFMKAANNAGLLSQFSQADLQMAQSGPNFGMSILGLKQNWQNATTDAERQSINDQANALRSSYGNYTGGADGSQYISTGLLNQKIDDQMDKINSYAPFSYDTPAPTYTNQYAAQQQALLNEILNREAFSWSKEDDPNWSAYKKEYLREGDRATANALAAASAASGGRPSSYAMTAAGQAGDYYAAQLSDKIPELYQQAYERYLNDQNLKYSDLNAVNNQEQMAYNKYLNDLSQWNTDRSFAYNDYQTQYNMLQNYLSNLQGQQQTEFNQGLTVQQYQDQIAQYQDALKQQAVENALAAAQVFGYVPENGADALGIAAGTPTAVQNGSLADFGSAFLQQGVMPSDAMLAAMGITAQDAQKYLASLQAQKVAKAATPGGTPVGTGDIYSQLLAAGATDYGTAYAMLLSKGYSSTEAKELASYFDEFYYPGNTTGTGGYKTLKYADLSAEAKNIADLIDSDMTVNYDRVIALIQKLGDQDEQNYLLRMLGA